ncbi:ZYRO0F14564p [Zygosaccharomyces rouxii]|uniref:ZYRO0F14564p n=1 Tax=Zygosaccharomyces rouxii (strain ATCC 2623 / CBS 732 / NBRC 1130 / NCYC 568 / NRRL Y-229) TaxID=559307 RepID=C5DYN9_ZYGRC|nr:uncharacterized protein ZYRO0F14564g [Zygosaccharomyces rouxii]KAH9199656.1 CrcB-like protein-domain-containing protein [Zygosaccharomyces rouxii]CAR28900.1 ZYRO0F14564p [Zygosaccharomyces rouxii]
MAFNIGSIWPQVIFHLSYVSATILGNYAREGTTVLATYKPSYVEPGSVIWSNLTSCIVMGMLQELNAAKWFAPDDLKSLFTVLTTGFCGAYSSYSTLMLETFQQSTSLSPSNIKEHIKLPNRAFGMKEFLAVLLTQLFTSMGAYLFGRGLSKSIIVPLTSNKTAVKRNQDDEENKPETIETVELVPKPWVHKMVRLCQWLLALLAIPLIATILVLTIVYGNYSRGKWTLFALFGIFGSYLRYQLSNWCNGWIKNFPMGTFIANELAVILIACFQIIIRGRKNYHEQRPVAHTMNSCRVTTALVSGFCGSLSTISTFINEAYKLEFNYMLIYYFVSVFVSYSLLVVIMGSYSWTRGLTIPMC